MSTTKTPVLIWTKSHKSDAWSAELPIAGTGGLTLRFYKNGDRFYAELPFFLNITLVAATPEEAQAEAEQHLYKVLVDAAARLKPKDGAMHRTVVRVILIDSTGVWVLIPGWSTTQNVFVPLEGIPQPIVESIRAGQERFMAKVSLGAENRADVVVKDWELPEQTSIKVECDPVVALEVVNAAQMDISHYGTVQEAYEVACATWEAPEVLYQYVEAEEVSPWVFRYEGFGVTLEARNPKLDRGWVSIGYGERLGYWDFGTFYGLDEGGQIVMFTVHSPHITMTKRPDYRG